ncbi:DUF2484 family protein [Aquicoccus porphyridii]|uniref:DUF2484 family protein n=1 Tax=Aquicoccus porphyridii TaxID=1852029 RepID=A0A5A9ZBT6_9RHOB|nr:DUF2484 family protein [Aquicoccus porphyridii]KAA0914641.1 DUF2484 family protein [Aquicoccus porphyridii]RAI53259.1 hypothetical protein DOO74_13100 [Rhodobacteraceae bacterium AsT-22]
MNLSLIALFVWLVVANMAAMLPSKDNHWRRAYGLMATGLPLLLWIFWENPWWVGLLALVAGLSVLRWPVIYLMRWLRRKVAR